MSQNPTISRLDPGQIIKRVYEESSDSIRTRAEITTTITGAQEIVISADDDSIAVRSSSTGNEIEPNADGSINTKVTNNLINANWDTVSVSYPTNVQEIYTYKTGGAGGTTVATVTIDYTDTTKNFISLLVRT